MKMLKYNTLIFLIVPCLPLNGAALSGKPVSRDNVSTKNVVTSNAQGGAIRVTPIRTATPTEKLPVRNPNTVKQQTLSSVSGMRIYEGQVRKFSLLKSGFYKVDHGLYQGGKCIACLKSDNLLVSERLKHYEGQRVTVKGVPDYINKEPFLVINVREIYGKKR